MSESDVSLIDVEHDELRAHRNPRQSDHTEHSYVSEESETNARATISGYLYAANSWQDVDREQLSQTVLKLISSVASTAPTDDKSRDAVWHPTTTLTVTQNVHDPLGFGKIDVINLRLERANDQAAAWQAGGGAPHTAAAMAAAATARQQQSSKGAVGRFFSELTRQAPRKQQVPTQDPQQLPSALGGPGSRSRRDKASSGRIFPAIPANKLLPSEEEFDPETYLAVFHGAASAGELSSGLRALEKELSEKTDQLQQLVKQNFERFISCKTTIDDIHVKLKRIESNTKGMSTEVLYNAIQEVQSSADQVFGPILDRSAKVERIKAVQTLLRRFSGLFSAPQRIKALAAARNFEQFKKANALIKPGHNTIPVWNSLYAEIEKREVQNPLLPAATASELVVHMLQLQAEGLAAAEGSDPLALLLAVREAQFTAAMAAISADHDRAVARLKAMMIANAPDEKLQLRPAGSGAAHVITSSRHLAELAPLSGLQLPPPTSQIVTDASVTEGEELYLRHMQRQSAVLLECLPGFWQASGSKDASASSSSGDISSSLVLPANLPTPTATKLQQTMAGAAQITGRLVDLYCRGMAALVTALAAAGPLREALLVAIQELASTTQQLEEQQAPPAALAAVQSILVRGVSGGVQQLVGHLGAVPAVLLARERWELSLTHAGSQPITLLPEQLQVRQGRQQEQQGSLVETARVDWEWCVCVGEAIHAVYLERKCCSIDRLLGLYIRADGAPVGLPLELKTVSHHAQQLVALAMGVQSDTYTYARSFMQQLMQSVLEHLGGALSMAFAALPSAAVGTPGAAAAAAGRCPVESLAQYFMDLVYLDAVLSKAGPSALSVDLAAAYQMLASRICNQAAAAASSSSKDVAETPLTRSLLAFRDPQELSKKLQVTCRKALRKVLEHSSFTIRGLLAGQRSSAGGTAATFA
eukprot:gene8992-9164_t